MRSPAKTLVQAIGNPLRSDDAVGPLLIERLGNLIASKEAGEASEPIDEAIDFEWVYQLQIEQAEQWRKYENVIVVDADKSATESVKWREITQQENVSATTFSSHTQSPESIYQLMRQFFDQSFANAPTRVFVLGIQAEVFSIGENLSAKSAQALGEAEKFLLRKLENKNLNF